MFHNKNKTWNIIVMLALLVLVLWGCGTAGGAGQNAAAETEAVEEPVISEQPPEPAGPPDDTYITEDTTESLWQKYAGYFVIGAAIDARSYMDAHTYLLKKHFNGVVCENEMKWENIHPSDGVYAFSTADSMVEFAEANNMVVRGHCLIWHNQTPGWVFRDAGATITKEALLDRIREHVTTVVSHYRGRVYAWDVVNEAISGNKADGYDAGEDLSQVAAWGFRNSDWYKICGEEYILEAFRAARKADPDAKLFYNDYWNYLDEKRAAIISLIVKKLQAEGLIDGIGLQCHLNISVAQEKMANQTIFQTPENLEREIREFAALGLDVHITELDVSIYTRDYTSSDESRWFRGEELDEQYTDRLAARYREFFDMLRRNSELIQNVTFWGIADDNTWLSEFSSGRPDHPLLFDKKLKAKKAFFAVSDFYLSPEKVRLTDMAITDILLFLLNSEFHVNCAFILPKGQFIR
ncbi:MAG: endo-1,4-beta-xylanase [Spirochaetales bacterium]|nr:endo-1,4-beta-xylanase [Spirochaetales bacterium]